MLTDPTAQQLIEQAGAHYAARNQEVAALLRERGAEVRAADGMSLWVDLPRPAHQVAAQLARRGWRVRTGEEFRLAPDAEPSRLLRVTVHDLGEDEVERFAGDLAGEL